MNCCQNQNDNKKDENNLVSAETDELTPVQDHSEENAQMQHDHRKHLLHMGLCCGLPILLLLVLPLLGYKGLLLTLAPLICPIMMLFMIPMMMKGHNHGGSKESCHSETKLSKDDKK